MTYATINDLQQRYGDTELRQLSDIGTPRTGAIVAGVLQRGLDDASAWIDSYLLGRYAVPVADASALAVLRLHCCAEARYLLMTVTPDDAATLAHQERERFFRAVAKGDISLIAAVDVPPAIGGGSVVFEAGSKVFGRDGDTRDDCSHRGGW